MGSTPVRLSTPVTTTKSLLEGNFDEDESKASFQDAVRAWREGGGSAGSAPVETGAMGTAPKPNVSSFWSKLGDDEVNLERCSTPQKAGTSTSALQAEAPHDPAPSEKKLCCYQCYKQ